MLSKSKQFQLISKQVYAMGKTYTTNLKDLKVPPETWLTFKL